MIHQESLMTADESYELRHDTNGNCIHVYIKDGEAVIYPTILAFISHQFMGEQGVERMYIDEEDLEKLYESEYYSYTSLKKIVNQINSTKISEEK